MASYELQPLTFAAPDQLHCSFARPSSESTLQTDVLVVAFHGIYPGGSLGKLHGQYIAVMTMQGFHAFSPHAVVLDLRDLEY